MPSPRKRQPARHAPPKLDDWNLLRSFIAIHDSGTLTAAAQRLGATQPSMGRHLRDLETAVGETLFTRLPGRLKPTARADALLETLLPMKQALREAQSLFAKQASEISGAVRISVSEVYGSRVLAPIIAPMLADQPGLDIEWVVSNRADNLLRRDADIAVRYFRPRQEDLIVRQLGDTELGLFAHEDYLKRHGEPKGIEDTINAVLAGFDKEIVPLGDYIQSDMPLTQLRFRFRTDSALARISMVEAGAVIGMMLTDVARMNPKLKRVLAQQVGLKQTVWLCAHDELRRSARMRYVWERLGDGLSAWLASARP